MRFITRWVKSFICACLNSHLNLGRKGTSSSKDKKLNCTVEARWKYKFTNIREMQKWDWEEKKSNMEKYKMWSFFTLDWFVLFLLLQLTVWYSGRSFGQKWLKLNEEIYKKYLRFSFSHHTENCLEIFLWHRWRSKMLLMQLVQLYWWYDEEDNGNDNDEEKE